MAKNYTGFIFQGANSMEYHLVIGNDNGSLLGIKASMNNGGLYYSNLKNPECSRNIKDILASFKIQGSDFRMLKKAQLNIKNALEQSRQQALERMVDLSEIEDVVSRLHTAGSYGDIGMKQIKASESKFFEQCDKLFTEYLMSVQKNA